MKTRTAMMIAAVAALTAATIIAASQCLGTTKKGERCKNRTNNASGYCYLHEGQAKETK